MGMSKGMSFAAFLKAQELGLDEATTAGYLRMLSPFVPEGQPSRSLEKTVRKAAKAAARAAKTASPAAMPQLVHTTLHQYAALTEHSSHPADRVYRQMWITAADAIEA